MADINRLGLGTMGMHFGKPGTSASFCGRT